MVVVSAAVVVVCDLPQNCIVSVLFVFVVSTNVVVDGLLVVDVVCDSLASDVESVVLTVYIQIM